MRTGSVSRLKHRTSKRLWCMLLCLLFTASLFVVHFVTHARRAYAAHMKKRAAVAAFEFLRETVRRCDALEYMGSPLEREIIHENNDVGAIVALTDATFVLTQHACKTSLPNVRWACVKGKQIDSCIPKNMQDLISQHGYATSVSHAFIFMHSHIQGYRHVSIIEDDAVFLPSTVSRSVVVDLQKVIQGSNEWSFVRLGYRPFFLEKQFKTSSELHGVTSFSCPTSCVCKKFGATFCQMTDYGCDMRSSHFYIANSQIFKRVITDLLDRSDQHRIIDWFVLQRYRNQIYLVEPVAMQEILDIPRELQEGFLKLFQRICTS